MINRQSAPLIFTAAFITGSLRNRIYPIILSRRCSIVFRVSGLNPVGANQIPASIIPNNSRRFPNDFYSGLANHYGISHYNYIKPGIGEATRVLLRREAHLLLLRDSDSEATRHLRWLAESKSIPLAVFSDLPYRAAALIKEIQL